MSQFIPDIVRRRLLASAVGAVLVGVMPPDTEAEQQTLNDLIRNAAVSPAQFGAVGDGVVNDKAAVQAALNSGRNVIIERPYFLGTANAEVFLTVTTTRQRIEFQPAGKLIANGNNGITNTGAILGIDGVSDVTLVNPYFESNWGVDGDRDAPYAVFLRCTTANCNNTTLVGPKAYRTQGLLLASKSDFDNSYEVNGIALTRGNSDENYYGVNLVNTGNFLTGDLKTRNNHRAYFAYGCHSHDFRVLDTHDGTVASPASFMTMSKIAAYSHSGSIPAKDTWGIRLKYTTMGSRYINVKLMFEAVHKSGHTMKGVLYDIEVDYNDRGNTTAKSIGFAYTLDGVPTISFAGKLFDRITLSGYAQNVFDLTQSGAIRSATTQTVKGYADMSRLKMGTTPYGVYDPFNSLFNRGFMPS